MANLEKPVPRNFTPEDVIPETVALSIGGVAGYLVGKLVNFSTPVAGALGVIGAIACALAARSRGVVGFALRKPKGEQISEVISYLSNHLGPEMTAFVSGAESPSTVGRWLAIPRRNSWKGSGFWQLGKPLKNWRERTAMT